MTIKVAHDGVTTWRGRPIGVIKHEPEMSAPWSFRPAPYSFLKPMGRRLRRELTHELTQILVQREREARNGV